jgi:hypothetical protein
MIAHILVEDPLCHTHVSKEKQRLCKRILIINDKADVTVTFKAGIEENNTTRMLTTELV